MKYEIPMQEFYTLNPKLIMRYQPFMSKRLEKRQEDSHFDGWVFGQYIAASIGANFSKRTKYPKEPYFMMRTEDDAEAHVLTDAERFAMWAMSFNANHKELKPPEIIDVEAKEITDSNSDNTDTEGL